MRPTHTERTAPLYARLLVEEYQRLGNEFARVGRVAEFVNYGEFLRSQADARPTSRGYCYHLALKEIQCV